MKDAGADQLSYQQLLQYQIGLATFKALVKSFPLGGRRPGLNLFAYAKGVPFCAAIGAMGLISIIQWHQSQWNG